ncbi:rhomboid family intramembrane serine protease [Kitasatospora sp. CM 4170]|uniref:Rhomboid family intramembrane serine protease n=1 Tax=Kitasatospora aburaviensis TaxID=67265 RepID=A0ABW1F971_9ACTN|nr:rhomboid family intramembrane serine protease [Kitasatospora sp. CM 4170]WNM46680.1 rhomboid family intramembrane serine protease [Kitasatospora sp. CM 4170]
MALNDRSASASTPDGSASALDPSRMIADARRALFTMVGVLAVVWLLQLVNWLDDYGLSRAYGVRAQELDSLPNIVTSPLLHWNWAHLEANSGPLFVFGFLAAYRGVKKFLGLTALLAVTSELTAWVFDKPNSVGVGASGLVFGYFGYVVLRGVFDRNLIDTLIGVVLGASYAYMVTGALPGVAPGISWAAHLGGLVGGLAGAWIFRDRTRAPRAAAPKPAAAATTTARTATGPSSATGSRAELLKELDDLGL